MSRKNPDPARHSTIGAGWFRRHPSVEPRCKRLRNLLDDLRSLRRGWYFRLVSGGKVVEVGEDWHQISEFTTFIRWRPELEEQNRNRLANMKLACRLIDGTHLGCGAVFSMRRIVGDAQPERGFREGPVIIRGRLATAAGGGLCQISTTLFNAALLANLGICEKWSHSSDIWGDERIIDLGRDASFAYAVRDLKFANDRTSDIVVRMGMNEPESTLFCRIYSPEPLGCTVEVTSTILERLEPDPGAGSRCGWVVLTTRTSSGQGGARVTYRKVETYQPTVATVSCV
ncbi:MAG: VanW family protein [bacterium]|nr:VanW family protein [bacterium]